MFKHSNEPGRYKSISSPLGQLLLLLRMDFKISTGASGLQPLHFPVSPSGPCFEHSYPACRVTQATRGDLRNTSSYFPFRSLAQGGRVHPFRPGRSLERFPTWWIMLLKQQGKDFSSNPCLSSDNFERETQNTHTYQEAGGRGSRRSSCFRGGEEVVGLEGEGRGCAWAGYRWTQTGGEIKPEFSLVTFRENHFGNHSLHNQSETQCDVRKASNDKSRS